MRIFFNIIKVKYKEYLSRYQYGFKRGSGTREEIFGLTITSDRYLEAQKDLYVYFVDI